jgi:peptide/nickel transport system substrate-binding protein
VAGGAALSLIGCGGGGDEGGVAGDASGLLSRVEDTSKSAIQGGTWLDSFNIDIAGMDPGLNQTAATRGQTGPVYQNLLKAGLSTTKRPGPESIVGDAAESWELSPDATKITLKLRPNIKWDPRPPTIGRLMTTDDVRWSWDKYMANSVSAGDLDNSKNPDAPVTKVEYPDARTMVISMAFPYVSITELLLSNLHFYIQPRLEGFDYKVDMRGSGPFILDSYTPSQNIKFRRNPDYYEKPYPFFEAIHRPLISEYNTGLSQFVANNIWNWGVKPEDILATKRSNPNMVMLATTELSAGASFLNFSKRGRCSWTATYWSRPSST